jgi:hypothetical protein
MQRTKREKNFPEPIAECIKSTKSAAQRHKKAEGDVNEELIV